MTEASDNLRALPTRTPRHEVWDVLVEHFGNPRMDTERKMFGRVVAELLRGGATETETRKACAYVLATFDSPSVNAVPKWFSVAQNGSARKTSEQQTIERLRAQS
jgi:hypothetical protein